jgi:nucleotide-binding universal stress UspA family protein
VTGLRQALEHAYDRDTTEAREAREYLVRIAAPWQDRSFAVCITVLPHERPAEAILSYAAEYKIDLIALATRGRSGLRRMMLGSVADKLIRGAESAVLVYRQQEDPRD